MKVAYSVEVAKAPQAQADLLNVAVLGSHGVKPQSDISSFLDDVAAERAKEDHFSVCVPVANCRRLYAGGVPDDLVVFVQ